MGSTRTPPEPSGIAAVDFDCGGTTMVAALSCIKTFADKWALGVEIAKS